MAKIVGIDLGTTYSLVATVELGLPLVIADAEGRRLTPSVVHFPSADAEPLVGVAANRVRILKPAETVYSIKRFMGRRASEIAAEAASVAYPIRGNGDGPGEISIHGKIHHPEDVSSFILKKLKADAEHFLGHEAVGAVITVPAYFNDAQRNATKQAGERAGFTVERILNEPTAAALAYGLDKLATRSKIAVYDLGGGTFDVSILSLHDGAFEVLATNGNTRLGGDDLDQRIVDHLITVIESAPSGPGKIRGNQPLVARIREAAEAAKRRLSEEETVGISLPFLTPDFSFSHDFSRAKLEDLTRDLVDQTRGHCLRALADARLQPKDLNEVILVGGQTRMPMVRRLVREIFGREPNVSINPEEAVALGAAIQGEILSGGFQGMLLLDVTPLSLGIETFGGLMNVIIPRNSTIPIKAGEMFTTAVDNQKAVLIHVLQGERELARDNWSLGRFTLEFDPAPHGTPRVGVQFEIDANGILHVLARDVKTGREKMVEMKSAVDVADAAVEKMIEESVEKAFEDLHQRQWIEARFKALRMIEVTRRAMSQVGARLPGAEREAILQAVQSLENTIATEHTETKTGDLKRLQAAHAALDTATEGLAALLVESTLAGSTSH